MHLHALSFVTRLPVDLLAMLATVEHELASAASFERAHTQTCSCQA
jgi:hypothetical protein